MRSRPELLSFDFDQRPFAVAWEVTRACALACRHCRAMARPRRDPDELTTGEAKRVIDEIADLGPAVLVLTGGDPMMRPDLFELVEYAVRRCSSVAVSPTTTALTTRDRLAHLRDLGVTTLHASVDGAGPQTHDAFRGSSGSFDRAMRIVRDMIELGFRVQIGTTVTRMNVGELPQIASLLDGAGIQMWNLFFLVPTGRGRPADMILAARAERTWTWMCDLAPRVSYGVRTTAAPQYRRTVLLESQASSRVPVRVAGAGYELRVGPTGQQTKGVNDGKGFVFIGHTGEICPSGFLPVSGGNVRSLPLADVYRNAELFRRLRDPSALTGRCGRCRFADLCGGSRARAYALTGSYLDDDPLCLRGEEEHRAMREEELS